MTIAGEATKQSGVWFARPSLNRRIAAAMVLSLVAIQGQAVVQIRLLSDPEIRMTGTRWLAEATRDVVRDVFAVPPERRVVLVAGKSAATSLYISWGAALPWPDPDESETPLAARLAATLRDVLVDQVKAVRVSASTVRPHFAESVRVTVEPAAVKERLGREPVRSDEPDVLIPAGVRIAVQGLDGSWVGVQPVGFNYGVFGGTLPYGPLLAGGLIIAFVSTWLARRMVAPLNRLVVAAERIGTAREPVRVETEGLHEFAAVARAFEDMQQRLLKFVEDRTRILAAISHDLRSSLTRLRLLSEPGTEGLDHAALSAEIDDMQSMVESTLTFASGEAQLAPNRPTDIAALLISLVDEASDAGKACTYQGADHIETMGHPVSLKRALWNVIDNALKYGGSADVGLGVAPSWITITVDDGGPGIAEESREDVFAPFRRLDPARGQMTPGVGLGLTIARDVVQSHGGTIVLADSPANGLRVMMTLPRR